MTSFVIGRTVRTAKPGVIVDAGLAAGRRRFELVVIDESGNQSRPAEVIVTITPIREPLPPLGPILRPPPGGGVIGPR